MRGFSLTPSWHWWGWKRHQTWILNPMSFLPYMFIKLILRIFLGSMPCCTQIRSPECYPPDHCHWTLNYLLHFALLGAYHAHTHSSHVSIGTTGWILPSHRMWFTGFASNHKFALSGEHERTHYQHIISYVYTYCIVPTPTTTTSTSDFQECLSSTSVHIYW